MAVSAASPGTPLLGNPVVAAVFDLPGDPASGPVAVLRVAGGVQPAAATVSGDRDASGGQAGGGVGYAGGRLGLVAIPASYRVRLRAHLHARMRALRLARVMVVQMAIAAGLAYFVAHDLLGHTNTYFAPVAATIVLSVVPGERSRRAVEMVIGIALGIAVADAFIQVLGDGAVQIALVVLVTVAAAILLGGGRVIASQAASAAILIAALPRTHAAPTRFVDALVGGMIGLAVMVVLPRNPLVQLHKAVGPVLDDLAAVLEETAAALDDGDARAAGRALAHALSAGALDANFTQLLSQARETARISPAHWASGAAVRRYAQAATRINDAARGVRVLVRSARTALEQGEEIPDGLSDAIRDLAAALRTLDGEIADPSDAETVEHALRAAGRATQILEEHPGLPVTVLIGQVRSCAVDILRALGVERQEASARVRDAAAVGA